MTHCFSKADNARLTFPVFVNAAPPANDNVTNETYPHWPANHYASALPSLTTSTYSEPGHKRSAFVWSNRKNYGGSGYNYKPNDLPGKRITHDGTEDGMECRTVFSTVGLANAATRIQIKHILGQDYSAILADQPGLLAVHTYAEWQDPANRASIFDQTFTNTQYGVTTTYAVAKDKVLLHPHDNPAKIDGIELDYEVQDGRSEAVSESFPRTVLGDIRRADKEAFLLINAWNQSGSQKSGITAAHIAAYLDGWDWVTLWLHVRNVAGTIPAAYDEQVAMLPADMTPEKWAKIVLRFELGDYDPADPDSGTTLADATWLRNLLTSTSDHPRAVQFHRSGVTPGGSCDLLVNQKIKRVCYGE